MATHKSIIAERHEYALHLATNFQPDVDTILSEGIACYGIKGSGKTNTAALLAEQVARFYIPMVIFDLENEYSSLLNVLPHGVLADAHRLPSGYDVLERGLQVVINLRSWDSDAAAALAMVQLIGELRTAAANQAPQDRVPCLLILDEAQYWLPQTKVAHLDKELTAQLRDEFSILSTRGRKLGLTPAYFTQRISEINKSVVSQAGIQILMRQTLDRDINRYFEYLSSPNTARSRSTVRAFRRGEAVICFPDGTQLHTVFNPRHTPHVSNSPRAAAALSKFRVGSEVLAVQ
jgi:DNA helicase HerA-like ATPase